MAEDSAKAKQNTETSDENKPNDKTESKDENNPTTNDNADSFKAKDPEEDGEEKTEETFKEKFLDTQEKLIEANNDMSRPGNREYLSFYIHQREWKPTKPIGPVTAQEKGPGPAVTNLPTTIGDFDFDIRKERAPGFVFGSPSRNKGDLDLSKFQKTDGSSGSKDERDSRDGAEGPGPAKYDTRTITNKGKEVCLAPLVGGRIKSPNLFMSPGPAAYGLQEGDAAIFPHSPAFSMRPRFKSGKAVDTPDPSAYSLPPTLGSDRSPFCGGPAFSMASRLDKQPKRPKQFPGPSDYKPAPSNVNREKAPAYSMGIMIKPKTTGGLTPGPASNDTHLVKFHKPATPRFTFGIRHSPYKAIPTFASGD